MEFEKRPYQEECIDIINNISSGKYLVVMATGLGKTYIFSRIKRRGRMLIISHREELVLQPKKFFDCSFGIELNKIHSNGEDVVSASTLTLVANERYKVFNPNEFDIIVVDEAHHSPARTYRTLLEYFKPRLLLGFTATPNRADGVRLDDLYSDIIYEKNIRWGIEHGYLSNIECIRVTAGFDLSKVTSYKGDYKISDLNKAMLNVDGVVVDAYYKYARGATLIFTVSVEQAERLQKRIKGSVLVTASTPNREEIINQLKDRKIPCVINCMVFTEGTDIPLCETIIIARPTKSNALYSQMVGRGLRVFPGKEKLRLIDIVGVTVDNRLCTAPSLLGISMKLLNKEKQDKIQGDILSLPDKVLKESDCPASWVKAAEYVELWGEENHYNLRNINWIQLPDGTLSLSIPKNERLNRPVSREFRLTVPDELGFTEFNGRKFKMQAAIDFVYNILKNCYTDCEKIWDSKLAASTWGKSLATEKQINFIKRSNENLDGINFKTISRYEASLIINRIIASDKGRMDSNIKKDHQRIKYESNKDKKKDGHQTEKSSNESQMTNRSVVEHLAWRYPKLRQGHNKAMLELMYGSIPSSMLNNDKVYSSLVKVESDRINKYGISNAFQFNGVRGVIEEFSKFSYILATNHIHNHKIIECSEALAYSAKSLLNKLSTEEKNEYEELINTIICDFRYAGGNYSNVSRRISRLLK